jgi:hypothetical protein
MRISIPTYATVLKDGRIEYWIMAFTEAEITLAEATAVKTLSSHEYQAIFPKDVRMTKFLYLVTLLTGLSLLNSLLRHSEMRFY